MRIITFKLPEDLLEELDRYASAHGRSRSDVIREAIKSYINYCPQPRCQPRIRVRRVVLA